jgi:1-deoxy-D-xylulose-5-phosphate reductoisomerase
MADLSPSQLILKRPVLARRRLAVLGSTGSIGTNCLAVVDALNDRMKVVGLTAHTNWPALKEQIDRYQPKWAVLTDTRAAEQIFAPMLNETELLAGAKAMERLVREPWVDTVVVAIVGAAGLRGSWAALEAGKTVALANKETLVMAGPQVMDLARRTGAKLLPVDSEHSAIFQLLRDHGPSDVERVVLTASGGPFRGKKAAELKNVRPEEALQHPTWRMGPKVTIDSATLMNKALEIIEAHWLFGLEPEQIEVVLHPESVVHSFVEFKDGAVLAQLSPPDMRLPIQFALTYPDRVPGPARRLRWAELKCLTFDQPDRGTFPALDLGYAVARRGGTSGAALNAANEAAVERFLSGTLPFLDIVRACHDVVAAHPFNPEPDLRALLEVDTWARQEVARWHSKT